MTYDSIQNVNFDYRQILTSTVLYVTNLEFWVWGVLMLYYCSWVCVFLCEYVRGMTDSFYLWFIVIWGFWTGEGRSWSNSRVWPLLIQWSLLSRTLSFKTPNPCLILCFSSNLVWDWRLEGWFVRTSLVVLGIAPNRHALSL